MILIFLWRSVFKSCQNLTRMGEQSNGDDLCSAQHLLEQLWDVLDADLSV